MDHNLSSGSLDLMHDIVIPPAIEFWPLAPGWYALGLILVAYLFYLILVLKEKHQANLYRKNALEKLHYMEDVQSILSLLKGVALYHYDREYVASLSDDKWWDFVQKHSKVKIDENMRQLSYEALYKPNFSISKEKLQEMKKIAKKWIQTHGVSNA